MELKTILLVDDNPSNLRLLLEFLEGHDLKVAVAQNGDEALARLKRTNFSKPDLILLDVKMPGIDGYETCRRIKSSSDLNDIPVIFLTSVSDTADMVKGFSVGAVDYITKPINLPELMARVNTHLELSSLRRDLNARISERTQELVAVNDALRTEIEERKRVENQIRYIVTHDSLTDLPNRIKLMDQLNQVISMARRYDEMIALMFLDLDQFKIINDSLGHRAGDRLLIDVAERLKNLLRDEDIVARLGGDEFVICLPVHDRNRDIMSMARKIFASLRTPFMVNDVKFHIGASIGISVFPKDGSDADTLLSKADIAMYHAKQSGRAEIKFYSDELTRNINERLNMHNLLAEGMQHKELFLEYQPQIDIATGMIVGAESLMRWRRSNGILVSPAEFIPIAEGNGFIKELGAWGLRESCAELGRWHDAGYGDLCMSINISVPQLHSDGFVESVQRALEEYQIEPSRLKLEITESLLMRYSKSNMRILNALHELGIRLSVDDFGTGYSSLAYLQDFPISELKIDRSFVTNIGSKHGNAIPLAIIAMAHSLGLRIVAEGVELRSQAEFLRTAGCEFAQGFYYSHSIPGEEFLHQQTKGGRREQN
ncbi:MAG: EAL domain-containing protein [Candidatus Thiodiazotropha taylori]|nr:EAL domain-containing protein [Candidatus Thiodiazotropha taylori]